MRITLLFGRILTCTVLFWLALARAMAAPATIEVSSAGAMDGFERYGNGLAWWTAGYVGDEVIRRQDGIIILRGVLPGVSINQRATRTFTAVRSPSMSSVMNGVVRTGPYVFFFGNSAGLRIFRKAIYSEAESSLGNDFSGVSYSEAGAMLAYGDSLIWSVVQGTQSQVRIKNINGPAGGGDEILFSGIGLVRKMAVARVPQSDAPDFYYLVMLTGGGVIYTYVLDPAIQRPGPVQLASNVTDFAVREETHRTGGGIFAGLRTTSVVYAATGANISNNRGSGRLVAFDLGSGGSFIDYDTHDANLQLTGVAVDKDRIFLTQTPVLPGGGIIGPSLDLAHSQILRRGAPSSDLLIGVTDYATIAVQQEGRNLRSDLQWLYWAHGNEIRKIKTDAPALELDYRAVGLEAVQTVQDYNNSIPLVAYKGTIVRAYAQLVRNTTGLNGFSPNAQLRGFLNGVELPISPIYPYSYGIVDTASDLPTLRGSLNRGFNFQLPDEWLAQPGSLRLDFTLNPTGSVPETGVAPLANNTASATLTIVPPRRPCVVFKVLSSPTPNYDMFAPNSGFGAIVDRANSMLPLDHLKTFFSPGSVVRPQFTIFGVKARSFDVPEGVNDALDELDDAQEDSHDPPGCKDVHWAGMFPPDVKDFNGLGERPGNSLILRMDAVGSRGGVWGSIIGGHSLAHELGHNYGRKHIDQTTSPTGCGTNKPAGDWDVEPGGQDPCTLGVTDLNQAAAPIGYDWLTDTLILPSASADMMTYGSPRWASPFTWNALVGAIPAGLASLGPSSGHGQVSLAAVPAAANPPASPPIFRVTGTIYPARGKGTLLPAWQYPEGTLDAAKVQRSIDEASALGANAPYRLRLLGDPQAAPLLEYPVAVSSVSEGTSDVLHFSQAVPFVEGVTKIELIAGGQVLAEVTAGGNAPLLQLDLPEVDLADRTLKLTWTASDPDDDPLLFTTQFSNDNGVTWQAVQVRDPEPAAIVSTALLAGGDQCQLRVLATDGLHTAIQMTEPFALPKQPPIIQINGLYDQQQFPATTPIAATAFAYDPDEGSLEPEKIQWTLSGPEPRTGKGVNFTLRSLPPGAYDISATAADSDGMTNSTTLHFQVRPIEIPDAAVPALDGVSADAGYANAPLVQVLPVVADRPPTNVRLVHSGGFLYVSFTDLTYAAVPNSLAAVGIYFDLNSSRDANSQSDDVGFGINEDGVLSQVAGNGSGMTGQPVSPAFTGEVVLGATAWSAELRIADSLLGGWNHESGLMIVHIYPGTSGQVKIWPPTADVNHPNTWSMASLGPLGAVANRAPIAVAHGPSLVALGEPSIATLDGTGSYDPDSNPLTYSWRQTAGPTVTLQEPATAKPHFATDGLTASAKLRFELVVNDGQMSSAPAAVDVLLVASSTQPGTTGPKLSISAGGVSTGGGGLLITSGPEQYDRQSIATDTSFGDYGWIGAGSTPVRYAVTIARFPGQAFSGFQAHIFLIANSSGSVSGDYDDPNVIMLDIQGLEDGTAFGAFRYKINQPGSNDSLYGAGSLGEVQSATGAVGTWSMTFLNDTQVTVTAPNGTTRQFTIPNAAALRSAFAGKVTAYFGNQANAPAQVGQSTLFSRIQISGTPRATAIDDVFPGPDLNASSPAAAWRWVKLAASPNGITVPASTGGGYSLRWTTPDTGFVLQFSHTLAPNSWTDANAGPPVEQGGVKTVQVRPSAFPGTATYFRLRKQ